MSTLSFVIIVSQNTYQKALPKNEISSIVYSLFNSIWNKILNSEDTVNNINIDATNTSGTGIQSCECANST